MFLFDRIYSLKLQIRKRNHVEKFIDYEHIFIQVMSFERMIIKNEGNIKVFQYGFEFYEKILSQRII